MPRRKFLHQRQVVDRLAFDAKKMLRDRVERPAVSIVNERWLQVRRDIEAFARGVWDQMGAAENPITAEGAKRRISDFMVMRLREFRDWVVDVLNDTKRQAYEHQFYVDHWILDQVTPPNVKVTPKRDPAAYQPTGGFRRKIGAKESEATGKETQSVLFDKDKFSRAEALAWAKKHGHRSSTSRGTENQWRVRQFPPEQCVAGSYANIPITSGVTEVRCTRRGGERASMTEAWWDEAPPGAGGGGGGAQWWEEPIQGKPDVAPETLQPVASHEMRFDLYLKAWAMAVFTGLAVAAIMADQPDEVEERIEFAKAAGQPMENVLSRLIKTEIQVSIADSDDAFSEDYEDLLKRRYWKTMEDERVCPICRPNEGRTEARATHSIPAHPDCRCYWRMEPVSFKTLAGLFGVRRLGAGTMAVRDPVTGEVTGTMVIDFDGWKQALPA